MIFILYKDGEARGQIEAHTKEERDLWAKVIDYLKSVSSQKS